MDVRREQTMNLREDFRRFVNETDQVVKSRRYKWLFAIAVILLFASIFHVFEPEYSQMRRVRSHIADIGPQWDAFKRAHPGFEAVELFPKYDEAWGVVFAARGKISAKVNPNQLAEFMRSTKPPVSVDVSRVNTDLSDLRRSVFKKVPAVTPDGRRIEIDVITELSSGADTNAARSKAESGDPAKGSQPIH